MRRNGDIIRLRPCVGLATGRRRYAPPAHSEAHIQAMIREMESGAPYRTLVEDVRRMVAEGLTLRPIMQHASMTASAVRALCAREGIPAPRVASEDKRKRERERDPATVMAQRLRQARYRARKRAERDRRER